MRSLPLPPPRPSKTGVSTSLAPYEPDTLEPVITPESLPMTAPVIAVRASADARLPAPLITVPRENPLPQFTLWAADDTGAVAALDTSDADATLPRPARSPLVARAAAPSAPLDTSDTDATLRRPTQVRLPTLDDPSELAPTIKRGALAPSDAAAILLARRFRATTQLGGLGDEDVTQKRAAKTNTLRPVAMDVSATEEIDLDLAEVAELPLDELDAMSADSDPEVIALYRRLRVRRFGGRTVTALVAFGVVLLGLGAARVGQTALAARVDVSAATTTRTNAKTTEASAHPAAEPVRLSDSSTQASIATVQAPIATVQAPIATVKTSIATAKPSIATSKAAPAAKWAPAATGKSTIGVLRTPASAKGHRVYVDGFVAGFAPNPISLRCGPHTVKVGSAGSTIKVVVPCGGSIGVGK